MRKDRQMKRISIGELSNADIYEYDMFVRPCAFLLLLQSLYLASVQQTANVRLLSPIPRIDTQCSSSSTSYLSPSSIMLR